MTYFKHERALVHPKAQIGEGSRIWAYANVLEGALVGKGCNVCDGCFVEGGAVVGDHVTLKNGVALFNGVTLEDDVFVGAGVTFINDRYPRSNRADAWTLEKTLVKKGATIGANATVMCGVVVGEYALIGCGSVVIGDVAPFTIVAGNPAVRKGYACRCGKPLNNDLQCPCGLRYRLENNLIYAL